MNIELFGRNNCGDYVFLGAFGKEEHVLKAIDEYYAMGYRALTFGNWKER